MNKKIIVITLLIVMIYSFHACTYDKAKEIVPTHTLPQNVSYKTTIVRIVSTYCNNGASNQGGCHGDISPSSGYFQSYEGLTDPFYVDKISGSINYTKGINMPKGESKLTQANIDSFDSWLNAGHLNN